MKSIKKRSITHNEDIDNYLNNSDIFKNELQETLDDLGVKNEQETMQEKELYLKSFTELLDSISSSSDKRKYLWKQIYENACSERAIAYIMWHDLYNKTRGNPNDHGIHGTNLSKYLERMSKANEQLLKLSEQISLVAAKNDDVSTISDDDIYSKLEKESSKEKN